MNIKAGWILAIGLLFFFGAIRFAEVTSPNSNEAWFADPARNLALHGHMGTTILEARGTWLEGVDRHTYWIMPVFPLVQAACYKVFGFGLIQLRLIAILSGFVLLLAWYFLARKALIHSTPALIAAALLAFETRTFQISANGRMDSLCAALGISGIAAFLVLRRSHPRLAMLLSHSCIALSGLTHPCGIVYGIDLLLLQYWLRCLNPLVLIPYVVFGSAFGIWIAQDPASFLSQFQGNVSGLAGEYSTNGRFGALMQPWLGLRIEIEKRYLQASYGWAGTAMMWAYFAGFLWVAVRRPLHANPRLRTLFLLTSLHLVFFWIGEGLKLIHYAIHVLPALTLLLVVAAEDILGKKRNMLAAVVLIALLIDLFAFRQNLLYRKENSFVVPVVAILKQSPNAVVAAPAEFGFYLGFDGQFKEDYRLGYFTGQSPDVFVTNAWQRSWLEKSNPIAATVRSRLSAEYHLTFSNKQYQVWVRHR